MYCKSVSMIVDHSIVIVLQFNDNVKSEKCVTNKCKYFRCLKRSEKNIARACTRKTSKGNLGKFNRVQ